MNDESKIWIYTANRTLTDGEVSNVNQKLTAFLQQWSAHGAALMADFEVISNRIYVVAVDETKASASGCSIDKLVHFFKSIESELQIDFFDRMQVAYSENGEVKFSKLNHFWAMRKAGIINDETLVYDTTIQNLGEWRRSHIKPFSKSWHADAWGR